MSDSESDSNESGAAMDMQDLYNDDGSEMSEEHNMHYSPKSPKRANLDKVSSKLSYTSPILCVAVYDPKDNSLPFFVTGSSDKKVIVWDLRSKEKIIVLKDEHSDVITSIAIHKPANSPAPVAVTASQDESVIIWDIDSGRKMRSFKDEGGGGITAMAIADSLGAAAAVSIITGNTNGAVRVWDFETGSKVRTLGEGKNGHDEEVHCIATFGVYAVTGSEDCSAIIWNVSTGAKLRTLDDHLQGVRCVAVHQPPEEYAAPIVVTGSDDETVILWNFHTGSVLRTLEEGHSDSITCLSLCVSPDKSFAPLIVTGSDDGAAAVWDLDSGVLLRKLENEHSDCINCLAVYLPPGLGAVPQVITGSDDRSVVIWELNKDRGGRANRAFSIKSRGLITKLKHDDCVNAVAIYVPHDAPPLIVTALRDGYAMVWDMDSAKPRFKLSDEDHDDWFQCVAVYSPPPEGKLPPMAILGCDDGAAIVFDLSTGKKLMVLEGQHEGEVLNVAVYTPPQDDFSHTPLVVTAGDDKIAVVWNLKTGDILHVLRNEHSDIINSVAIYLPARASTTASYQPLVLTGSDDSSIVVWDLKSGNKVRTIRDEEGDGSEINSIAVFEPTDRSAGPVVVSGDESGRVVLWDLASGELLRTLAGEHDDGVLSVAVYTPRDKRSSPFIVSTARDHTIVLWDMYTGTVLRTLEGVHDDEVMGVAIYAPPDGSGASYVVTVSDDCTAVIWDLNAAQLQASIEGGHGDSVTAVAIYVPTGKGAVPLVITGSSDYTMIVWELQTGKKLRILNDNQYKEITALAVYSPGVDEGSSPLLISANTTKLVSIWNLQTFKRVRQLTDHTGDVNCLAVHGPSSVVVSGSADTTAIVWNVKSGKNLRTIAAHNKAVTAVAVFSYTRPDQTEVSWVVTGSEDGGAVISDLSTGKLIRALKDGGHKEKVTAIAVCMRDPVFERTLSIVTGSTDGTILVWEATGGVRFAITCEDPVLALAFCQRSNPHDGEICSEITASLSGGVLSVWDLRMGDFVRTIKENQGGLGDSEGYNQGHDSIISLALYVPEHGGAPPLAVTGGKDGVAMIWNYTHGGRPCKLEGGHGMTITCLAVHVPPQEGSPALVVTGSKDDTCIVWDISSGVKVRTLEADESIKCVAIHQPEEGNPQVIAGTVIGDLHIWDLHTGEVIRKIDCGHILSLALFEADDGGSEVAMVATCDNGSDSAVKVWRISDGAQKLSLNCEHNSVQVVAVFTSTTCYKELNVAGFSDDVFIIGGHFGHTATVWMYPSGKTLHTLKGAHTGPITALAVSPSHQERPILVTGSADCTAVVWDLISGQVKFVLKGEHEDSVTSVLLDDSSGTLLAVTSSADSTVAVWNATTGEHIRSLTATDGVTALAAYHPSDGATTARILAACEDCTVKVWADCLLPSDYMPLAGSVMKLMEMEIAQAATIGTSAAATTTTAPWSRLREVADNYGESFWLENYRLFSSMFESSVKPTVRDSFFRTFKAALPKVIHRLPNVLGKSKGKRKSLLEVCIEDNLDIRRIVLDAWVVTLNSPISSSDFLRQAYHPSVHLSKEVLLKLAQSNPGEFISFICRLKLVKSHEAVFKSCPTYDIDRKGGVIIEGMPPTVSVDMWSSIAGYYASKTAPTGIKGPQPVTALMIPLIGAADLQMLNAYVDTSNAVDSLDIFESDVGITAFKYAWVSFGYPIHIVTTLRYASFIALYTASVFLFDRLQQNRRFSVYFWAWALQCAVLLCILYYMVDEARQFWNENKERVEQAAQRVKEQKERAKELARRKLEQTEEEKEGKYEPGQHRRHFISKSAKATAATTARRRNPALYTGCRYVLATLELKILTSLEACALKLASICNVGRVLAQWWDSSVLRMVLKHFSGFWNMVDLAVMATVTAGTVLRCVNLGETNSSRCILSVGSVLVWFKVLNFMRPFKHSGPLVAMILRIMQDIQYFVFILATVLTGFSMAFWLISYPDHSLEFGTIKMAFLNSYLYMLGQDISTDFSGTASPELGVALLVAFMFFMIILMLNLLIALMGNSYSKVQEKGLAEWRLGQASMILEQSYLMTERARKVHEQYSSIHVLKYTSLLQLTGEDDDAEGGGGPGGERKEESGKNASAGGADGSTGGTGKDDDRLARMEAMLLALQKKLDEK